MTPQFSAPGRWVADPRGDGRGVRVSAHTEAGFLVLSTWRSGVCVGTVHLLPDEAADLVAGLAESLGRLAARPAAADEPTDRAPRSDGALQMVRGDTTAGGI
jgi:hypothetical protein